MRSALTKTWTATIAMWCCVNLQGALVQRVEPFEGQVSDGFENVTSGLTNVMDGLASVCGLGNTGLTVQDGTFPNLWDQHAFEANFFLGASAGRGEAATVEVTFKYPVSAFGGSFGHRVHPLMDTTQETEFVFYDANDRVVGRDNILIGPLPGAVNAHWKFTRSVKRITFTCVAPMADALTVRLSNAAFRRFTRDALKAKSASSLEPGR